MLFLIVWSLVFHGGACIPGELGGVGEGLLEGVLPLGDNFGLVNGEDMGLPVVRLAFLL